MVQFNGSKWSSGASGTTEQRGKHFLIFQIRPTTSTYEAHIRCVYIYMKISIYIYILTSRGMCFSENRNLFFENWNVFTRLRPGFMWPTEEVAVAGLFFEKWNSPLTSCFTRDVDQRGRHTWGEGSVSHISLFWEWGEMEFSNKGGTATSVFNYLVRGQQRWAGITNSPFPHLNPCDMALSGCILFPTQRLDSLPLWPMAETLPMLLTVQGKGHRLLNATH